MHQEQENVEQVIVTPCEVCGRSESDHPEHDKDDVWFYEQRQGIRASVSAHRQLTQKIGEKSYQYEDLMKLREVIKRKEVLGITLETKASGSQYVQTLEADLVAQVFESMLPVIESKLNQLSIEMTGIVKSEAK